MVFALRTLLGSLLRVSWRILASSRELRGSSRAFLQAILSCLGLLEATSGRLGGPRGRPEVFSARLVPSLDGPGSQHQPMGVQGAGDLALGPLTPLYIYIYVLYVVERITNRRITLANPPAKPGQPI